MYSPKIKEDLIPILYRMGKSESKPMTRIVDEIIRLDLHIRGLIGYEQGDKKMARCFNNCQNPV